MANRILVNTGVLQTGINGFEAEADNIKRITGDMLNIIDSMGDAYKTTEGSVRYINKFNELRPKMDTMEKYFRGYVNAIKAIHTNIEENDIDEADSVSRITV